jgi:hypothetical protein
LLVSCTAMKKIKKLAVQREAIRVLSTVETGRVIGGGSFPQFDVLMPPDDIDAPSLVPQGPTPSSVHIADCLS